MVEPDVVIHLSSHLVLNVDDVSRASTCMQSCGIHITLLQQVLQDFKNRCMSSPGRLSAPTTRHRDYIVPLTNVFGVLIAQFVIRIEVASNKIL